MYISVEKGGYWMSLAGNTLTLIPIAPSSVVTAGKVLYARLFSYEAI